MRGRDGNAPPELTITLAILSLGLIWGSTWVVIKIGLEDLGPFTSGGARFLAGGLAMVAVVRLLGGRESGERPPLALSLLVGLAQFGIAYGLVYWASLSLPSGLVAVLWSSYPLILAPLGHRFLPTERLSLRAGIGFVVGFLGVACLFATDLGALGGRASFAALLLLLSPLSVALATIVLKRAKGRYASLPMTRDGMATGGALLLLVAFLTEDPLRADWTPRAVASIAYLTLVGSVLAFSVYFWVLRHAPATRLALVTYMTPPTALLCGALVLGETPSVWTGLGMGLIFLGILLARDAGR